MLKLTAIHAHKALLVAALLLTAAVQSANATSNTWPTLDELIGELICPFDPGQFPYPCSDVGCFPYCTAELDPRVHILQSSLRTETEYGWIELLQAGNHAELSTSHGATMSLRTMVEQTSKGYTLLIEVSAEPHRDTLSFNFYYDDIDANERSFRQMIEAMQWQLHWLSLAVEPDTAAGPKFDQCMTEIHWWQEVVPFLPVKTGYCLAKHGHIVDD